MGSDRERYAKAYIEIAFCEFCSHVRQKRFSALWLWHQLLTYYWTKLWTFMKQCDIRNNIKKEKTIATFLIKSVNGAYTNVLWHKEIRKITIIQATVRYQTNSICCEGNYLHCREFDYVSVLAYAFLALSVSRHSSILILYWHWLNFSSFFFGSILDDSDVNFWRLNR